MSRLLVPALVFLIACGSSQTSPVDNGGGSDAADLSPDSAGSDAGAGGGSGSASGGSSGAAGGSGSGGAIIGATGGAGGNATAAGGTGGKGGANAAGGNGGAHTGGVSGAGGSGGVPGNASGSDARPADTSPSTYPFCRDPDKVTNVVSCARLDQFGRAEWQRKDGNRCAICTWQRPTGVEQQIGCIRPVPQVPGQDSTSILCVMTCNECAY